MSVAARASALRAAGYALRITGYVVLLAAVYLLISRILEVMPLLSEIESLDELTTLLRYVLTKPLLLILISMGVGYVANVLLRQAENTWENFILELLGVIESYKSVRLSELAARFGIDPASLEALLARLRHEGRFRGVISRDGFVHAGELEAPVPSAPVAAAAPPPPETAMLASTEEDVARPSGTVVKPPSGETEAAAPPIQEETRLERGPVSTQAPSAAAGAEAATPRTDLEERRRRIEEMYRKGIISRETYMRLLRELEGGGG